MKKLFLSFLVGIFALMSTLTLKAQVTVGANEGPVPGAILQVKTTGDAVSNGNVNATQGIGFPRVALVTKDLLQPMYSAADAPHLTDAVKMEHKGLVVYNVTDDDNVDLSPGLYQWDGTQWTGFAQKTPAAVINFPTDCSTITVDGDYFTGTPLNSSNYITIPVTVVKAGYYTISAVPKPDNGYYFSTSGTFMTTGPVLITIQGAGQPKNFTPTGSPGDALTLVCNVDTAACTPYVFVQDGSYKPYFAMSCNSVTVNGVYKKGVLPPTPNTETITLRLNVYAGAAGATWTAKTDVIDSLWFEGTGVLGAPGTQDIVLYAQGASTNTAPKTFTIITNSQSTTATCSATVVPVIGAKRIIAFGDDVYGFMSAASGVGCYSMVADPLNYGTNANSIVKYDGFSSSSVVGIGHLGSYTGPIATLPTAASDWDKITAKGTGYDIIIITYPAQITTQLQVDSLTSFVNRGGVLIDLDQFQDVHDINIIQSIFGEPAFSTYANGARWIVPDFTGTGYLIKMNPIDDVIMNGPFGDIRYNTQWGDDSGNTTGLFTVPFGAIVYAGATGAVTGIANVNGTQVTILRHPTKNFFWCGDSGLIAANNVSSETTNHPFKIGPRTINSVPYSSFPYQELYGLTDATHPQLPVCNSILFANVMAWAITQAEQNGINSGQ